MPIFNLPKYPRDPTTGVFHPRRNSYGTNRRGEPVPCAIPSGLIAENRRSKCPPFTANQRLSNSQHTKCSVNERIDATSWKHLTIGVFINNNGELGKHVRAELYRLYEMQCKHLQHTKHLTISYLLDGPTDTRAELIAESTESKRELEI